MTDTGDGTTYLATDGPDIFVYDFSQADTTNDTFEIYNFDSSEDTLIFTNAEAPGEGTIINSEVMTDSVYNEAEVFFSPLANSTFYEIGEAGPPFGAVYEVWATRTEDGILVSDSHEELLIYSDKGTTLSAEPLLLDYPDDTTDPTTLDPQFAHVYEGDPLAVEGIA